MLAIHTYIGVSWPWEILFVNISIKLTATSGRVLSRLATTESGFQKKFIKVQKDKVESSIIVTIFA